MHSTTAAGEPLLHGVRRVVPRTVRRYLYGLCAAVGLLGVALLLLRPATSDTPNTSSIPGIALGAPAPDFVLNDLRGSPVKLSGLRGRWILLNFWGVTCPPCQSEVPALERAFAAQSRGGPAAGSAPMVLGVDGDLDQTSVVNHYAERLNISYPILIDSNLTVMTRYHIGALPTSLVIDPAGRVATVHLGPMSSDEIATALHGQV